MLKQQLNGKKWRKMRWRANPLWWAPFLWCCVNSVLHLKIEQFACQCVEQEGEKCLGTRQPVCVIWYLVLSVFVLAGVISVQTLVSGYVIYIYVGFWRGLSVSRTQTVCGRTASIFDQFCQYSSTCFFGGGGRLESPCLSSVFVCPCIMWVEMIHFDC